MNLVATTTAILSLIAGIGIFLIACNMMSLNLEAVSSNKLKALFSKASKSKMVGVGIGTVGTAAIQSSGATTVMVIGFVNAGIMSLAQAATVIYGANIGTTITGQIVALGMFEGESVSTTVIFSTFAGLGAFVYLFAKKDLYKRFGGIFAGFGMLFVGLSMMSGSMEVFSELESIRNFLAAITSPILLVLVGALLTAIIQSSSVMTSIAITMVVTGLITLDQGIYLTMGSNIGSCVVAILAGLTGSINAKRTALIHLIFNVSGVIVFMVLGGLLVLCTGGALNYGILFERMFPGIPQTQLAMFHTFFNVFTVILILPLTNVLVKTVTTIIPERVKANVEENQTEQHRLYYVDNFMLKTPPIAVAQVKSEIINMADIAMRNFNLAIDIISTLDFTELEQFDKNEDELNFINKELVRFVVELSNQVLNEKDHRFIASTFHSISDIERVGDYAVNIIEYAKNLQEDGKGFSTSAIAEIQYMQEQIEKLFELVIRAYAKHDLEVLKEAEAVEEEIDTITDRMATNHITRLNHGICTALVGAQYLSLASNSERVADHFMNIGKMVKQW